MTENGKSSRDARRESDQRLWPLWVFVALIFWMLAIFRLSLGWSWGAGFNLVTAILATINAIGRHQGWLPVRWKR
jgi:hypothetical protein